MMSADSSFSRLTNSSNYSVFWWQCPRGESVFPKACRSSAQSATAEGILLPNNRKIDKKSPCITGKPFTFRGESHDALMSNLRTKLKADPS